MAHLMTHIPIYVYLGIGVIMDNVIKSAGNYSFKGPLTQIHHPRWLSGLRRSRVHSLMVARRSLCHEKLGSNPGQRSKGINFSSWHALDMPITVTKRC